MHLLVFLFKKFHQIITETRNYWRNYSQHLLFYVTICKSSSIICFLRRCLPIPNHLWYMPVLRFYSISLQTMDMDFLVPLFFNYYCYTHASMHACTHACMHIHICDPLSPFSVAHMNMCLKLTTQYWRSNQQTHLWGRFISISQQSLIAWSTSSRSRDL